jgi:hypothetical protein
VGSVFCGLRGAFDTSFNRSGSQDVFVTKLNASGSALTYSTFLVGTRPDVGVGIAERDGKAYVSGKPSPPTTQPPPSPLTIPSTMASRTRS